MPRNKRLELNNVGSGKWVTSDGRFAVVRRQKPVDVTRLTANWKPETEYSIRSFEDYDGPQQYAELAPEVAVVQTFKEVYPWLGEHTGEGSFERGDPEKKEAKPIGGKRIQEARDLRAELLG
jgi:hypothetical protein